MCGSRKARRTIFALAALTLPAALAACQHSSTTAHVLKPLPTSDLAALASKMEAPTGDAPSLDVYDLQGSAEVLPLQGIAARRWAPLALHSPVPDSAQIRVGSDSRVTLLDPGRNAWTLDRPGIYRVQRKPAVSQGNSSNPRWRVFRIASGSPPDAAFR